MWLLPPPGGGTQACFLRRANVLSRQHCLTPRLLAAWLAGLTFATETQKPFAGGSSTPSLIILQRDEQGPLSQSLLETSESLGLTFLWKIQGKAKGFMSAGRRVPWGRLPGLTLSSNDCLLFEFLRARWMKMSRKY